jgi:hypothetical protein
MTQAPITIRRARRDDVAIIIAMLADDPLGSGRERQEDPLPPSYFEAFETVDRDPRIQLVVAEEEGGAVVGCLQLCILPGLSSQGAFPRTDRGCPCRLAAPQPRHRRTAGAMGGRGSACQRMQAGRIADALYPRRRAAVLCPARVQGEPCRHDRPILTHLQSSGLRAATGRTTK